MVEIYLNENIPSSNIFYFTVKNLYNKKQFTMVWFLCLMAYQLFLGYLMPKPFSWKNSSGTI